MLNLQDGNNDGHFTKFVLTRQLLKSDHLLREKGDKVDTGSMVGPKH